MTHWTSATDLARLLSVPVGTIHRWANEDDWPRRGRGRHTRYHHERAVESYEARRVCDHDRVRVTDAVVGKPEADWPTIPGPCRKCGH